MAYWNLIKLRDLEIGLVVDLEFTQKKVITFEAVKVLKFIKAGVPLNNYEVDSFFGTERENYF